MNKERFMIELERLLRGLPADEKEDALNYYREYIEDAGFSDIDDVTDKLGTPKSVARSIIGESVDKYVEEQKESKSVKSGVSSFWRILLYIFAAPFAIPMVIAFAAVSISVGAALLAVVLALLLTGGALVLAGCVLGYSLFWSLTIPQFLMIGGATIFLIALGIIWCIVFYKIGGVMMSGMSRFLRWMFVRKKEEA